jgi:hypothetical protein
VDRLAWVQALPLVTYPNGDQASYLDHTFSCSYVSGDAHVADDESSEVGWFPPDGLPDISARLRARMASALSDDPVTRFER